MKTKEDLIKEGYPSPHHDRYYCYVFDEEVHLGTFDIERVISTDRINYSSEIYQSRSITKKYPEGRPIFLKGNELLRYDDCPQIACLCTYGLDGAGWEFE